MNRAVDDVAAAVSELVGRGVWTGDIVTANKGVEFCAVGDTDGNVVSLIGNFRVRY